MTTTKATAGEIAFYEKIKTGEVRAIHGKSDKGDGWRPVCRGYYLGGACRHTEKEAIANGIKYVAYLKSRVEGTAPPISHKPATPKRVSKKKDAAK